ncbi:LacI family DNA-binding transcriptional regulator [Streptomyces sp. NPDC059740]|uniref:LacI family DNA-binding transcriptional regulator n=1 Tax=Streptomyces sp. NPDC059740 TaxID=3346926 RepID=UPI003664969F
MVEHDGATRVARAAGGPVTVRAIAAEAGVSIATVSRAMNGAAGVTPRTRELVRQAVERLGGEVTPSAPRRDSPLTVHVRCPYVLTDYFGLVVSSVAETLELHGVRMLLDAGEAAQQTRALAALPRTPGVDGALLILPPEPASELTALRAAGPPFVVVDPRLPPPRDLASVSAAHFAGARAVTAHLVSLGHRRIGVISGPPDWLASDARLAGHTAALAEAGVLPSPRLTEDGHEPTIGWGESAGGRLLDLAERPTALVAFNDKVAAGALLAARRRGLRVPEDLSITGFDDIDVSRVTHPQLTTVRQPLQEMGRMAVSLLMRLVRRHTVEALHVELATELTIRGSTGPAPQS